MRKGCSATMKIAHRGAFGGLGLLGNPAAAQGNPVAVVSTIADPDVRLLG
jgi:hypothetical protein